MISPGLGWFLETVLEGPLMQDTPSYWELISWFVTPRKYYFNQGTLSIGKVVAP